VSATQGQPGTNGSQGVVGFDNANGGSTPKNLNFVVQSFIGVFEVEVLGGNGGNGGRGGPGQDGGEGQDGGKGDDEVSDAPGGAGGNGGLGGPGGNGGIGGDANSFNLYIPNAADVITIQTDITFSGGFRGNPGKGGPGGNPGLGGFRGRNPNQDRAISGQPGQIGPNGNPGARDGISGELNIYVGFSP
jgi:hypothetical protein